MKSYTFPYGTNNLIFCLIFPFLFLILFTMLIFLNYLILYFFDTKDKVSKPIKQQKEGPRHNFSMDFAYSLPQHLTAFLIWSHFRYHCSPLGPSDPTTVRLLSYTPTFSPMVSCQLMLVLQLQICYSYSMSSLLIFVISYPPVVTMRS